jgi:hypothetical protein
VGQRDHSGVPKRPSPILAWCGALLAVALGGTGRYQARPLAPAGLGRVLSD